MDQAAYDTALAEVEATTESGSGGGGGSPTAAEIQAMVDKAAQQAADRVRTEAAKEKKALNDELEKIKREKMTDDERAKDDVEKMKADLQQREDALNKKTVELHTVNVLADKKINPNFKDFLIAETTEATDARIATFETVWNAAIKTAVEDRFKQGGGEPPRGTGGGGGVINPWSKATLNYSKQGEIMRTNPELAKQLQAAAIK